MFYIIISEKGGAERRESFDKSVLTVGRVQDNDLTLAKGNVSKRHCRIEFTDGRFVVTDEDSTNGTYVNRRRIAAPTIVREGDRIYVGDFILRIETTPASENTDQVSEPGGRHAPQIVPQSERDEVDFARTATAPADSMRPAMGPPPIKVSRRAEMTSAFPAANADLLAVSSVAGGAERAAARTLVEEVWRRLEPRALERMLDAEASDRVVRILAEQVLQLPSLGHSLSQASTDQALALARNELLGLGPLDALLDDARVSEILVGGAKRLLVTRDGTQYGVAPFCHPESVEWALARLCRQINAEVSEHELIVRRWLRHSGLHLEAARGQVSSGGALMRLYRPETSLVELDDLVHVGTLSRTMATFLRYCVTARLNVLVVGRPHSGYQEVLGALASLSLPPLAWLQWSFESQRPPPAIDCQRVHLSPEVDVVSALGLLLHTGHRVIAPNPPNIALRGLVDAVAKGLDGLLVAQEGASIETTLLYWSQQLATADIGPTDTYKLLTRCFDLAVEVSRLGDGRSRVMRIGEFRAKDATTRDVFDFVVERTASGGSIEGHFRGTGEPPTLLGALRSRGTVVDESLFLRPPSE